MTATDNIPHKEAKKAIDQSIIALIDLFAEKQGLTFHHIVGNEILGIIHFEEDYFFNATDIYHDVFTNQPKELITEWYYECLDHQDQNINYQSYTMGLRFDKVEEKQ